MRQDEPLPSPMSSRQAQPLLFSFPADEFARQISARDATVWKRIAPTELVGGAWRRPDKCKVAPNVVQMTTNFNDLSAFVATSLLSNLVTQVRVKVYKYWLSVCEALRHFGNFNSALAVWSGLDSSHVRRLPSLKRVVSDRKRTGARVAELSRAFSVASNWAELRLAQRASPGPTIPYVGLLLTDITAVEEGTQTCTHDGLINYGRLTSLAAIVGQLVTNQQSAHYFDRIAIVQSYLRFIGEVAMNESDLLEVADFLAQHEDEFGARPPIFDRYFAPGNPQRFLRELMISWPASSSRTSTPRSARKF